MSRSDSHRRLDPWRLIALLALVWALTASVMLWLDRYHERFARQLLEEAAARAAEEVEPPPDRLVLRPETYDELPGWARDRHARALEALRRSCRRFLVFADTRELRPVDVGGTVADWRAACQRAARVVDDDQQARMFFEQEFRPFRALNNEDGVGLFTGYYEPSLDGSRRPSHRYSVPLLGYPNDIVEIDLGEFRSDLEGMSVGARIVGRRVLPYADRQQIVDGALRGRGLELLWVDDPIDAFFLQIQGSGRVNLDDGTSIRVGYAGQNGHAYYAVGRALIERGEVPREKMSMQAIRTWLEDNPDQADELMALNRSYVFFRELQGEGPIGSQGVVLTPRRSLAVDRRFVPMGAPVWLDGYAPAPTPGSGEQSPTDLVLRRLLIAQDTGGAIRGPVRGDVFWGPGEEAADIAGRMRHRGRYWLLLPLPIAERLESSWAADQTPSD